MQPTCTFRNDQRESVYRENCFLTGRQLIGLQYGQSYQQPLLSQTIPDFSKESYISTMVQIFYMFFFLIIHISSTYAYLLMLFNITHDSDGE